MTKKEFDNILARVSDLVEGMPRVIKSRRLGFFDKNYKLGKYDSEKNVITVYTNIIDEASNNYGIPSSAIIAHTLFHEYFHKRRTRDKNVMVYEDQLPREEKLARRFSDKMLYKLVRRWKNETE